MFIASKAKERMEKAKTAKVKPKVRAKARANGKAACMACRSWESFEERREA